MVGVAVGRDQQVEPAGPDQVEEHVRFGGRVDQELGAGGPAAQQVAVVVHGAHGHLGEHQVGQLPHLSRTAHLDPSRVSRHGPSLAERARCRTPRLASQGQGTHASPLPARIARRRMGGAAVQERLVVRGAREHNLKDVSLDLPRDALIVFTGLSGSGKSSLAFDTIFAEGQRRYVESPVGVRPPVPRADGQARRRLHRGPLARGLDRPEVDEPQPALHGRHDHRGLRLPAPAVRAGRHAALPDLRRRHRAAVAAADRRPHPGARRGHPVPGARAGGARRARASTSTCSASSRARATAGPASTAWSTPWPRCRP